MAYEQWNLKETDAICFKSKKKQEIWLSGVGLYEITTFPQKELYFNVSIFDGNQLSKQKLIFSDNFEVKPTDEFLNHIGRIFFQKAIKIEHDKPYTIGMIDSNGSTDAIR